MTNIPADPDEELDSRKPLVVTLEGVLTALECTAMIARIEAAGPTAAPITTASGFVHRPDIRNNTRAMFDDVELATRLFERAAHEGAPVKQGLKYVLRSDLMYRRDAAPGG